MSRRGALQVLLAGLLLFAASPALAEDGGGNSGNGGGNSGNGGNDDGGDDGGDDNSGDGGGDDGGDDNGGDDGGGVDGGDEGSRARDAVRNGEAASLREILAVVRQKYSGQLIRVKLAGSGNRLFYNIRLLDSANRLIDIRVNAKSRRIVSTGATVY